MWQPLGMLRGTRSEGRYCGSGPTAKLAGVALLLTATLLGCENSPSLSKETSQKTTDPLPTPDLGPVGPDSPKIGALSDVTPVYSAASKKAPVLGLLHAGAVVPRSEQAHENEHCTEGWYAVAPRGYVCTEKSATTDLEHPTLIAMSIGPSMDKPLPYVYARTRKVTALFQKSELEGVELRGRLAKNTVMAIVGSWTAPDESKEPQRLGLKMDGTFVRADDLEAAPGSDFSGIELSKASDLPVAFVVRRGVRAWEVEEGTARKTEELPRHTKLALSGRFRTIEGHKFWATADGRWVRHQDVIAIRRRHEFPDYAKEGQKWLDVSIITGSLIAYEGQTPVFTTLVSVGRDRLGDPETSASTARGSFRVVEKHITRRINESDDAALHDAPWALKLENGQWLQASPHHSRFGIEHTDGNIEVSPADGARLFQWATPDMPEGWHGMTVEDAAPTTIVHVRK